MVMKKSSNLLELSTAMALSKTTNLSMAKRVLEIGISKKGLVHFWFHFWNFGETEKDIKQNIHSFLEPLLLYAAQKEESGLLSFETMSSIRM